MGAFLFVVLSLMIISYKKGKNLFACNFNPNKSFEGYFIETAVQGEYSVIFSTDDKEFGGFSRIDKEYRYQTEKLPDGRIGFKCYLPSRTALVFKKQ